MALTLHRGPPFGAASRAARAAWADAGGLLVLRDRDAVRAALAKAAGPDGVVLDREAVTPAGLRARVRRAAGLGREQAPSAVGARLVLQEALAERIWPGFGQAATAPGFLAVLERAVAELRAARVAPAELAGVGGDGPAADLAALYGAVEGRLRLRADLDWEAADAAAGLAGFPPVAVDGFDDLAPATWATLRALGRSGQVAVAMPHEPGRAAYRARDGRQEAWAEQADAVIDHPAEPGGPADLEALRVGLFEDRPGLAAPVRPGAVRVVLAAGTRGMHRAAAEEVLALCAEGLRLAEIALVVPRLAEARDELDRLLEDWAIPARRSTRVRFLEAPIGLALARLLELGELDPDDPGALGPLVGWLRTPYSGADPAQVDDFERDALRGGLERRRELIGRWSGPAIEPARALVAAGRAGPRAAASALARAGWDALARATSGRLRPGRADRRDLAAVGALAGLAAELEAAPVEDGRPRGPVPRGRLGRLLADLTLAEDDGPPDGLAVVDYGGLRGRRLPAVVLCGLDSAGYPGRPSPDPLLGPVRAALAGRLPPRSRGTDEARLRMLQAVASAGERLVLVRRFADDDGREMAPSPYWDEALRLLALPYDHADRRTGGRGELCAPADTAPTRREALRAVAADGGSAPGELAEALSRRRRPDGLQGRPWRERDAFSVTSLEAWLRCGYGWLHDRVLRPAALEEPFDARAEGSLGHEVLERLYRRMRDGGIGACTPAALPDYLAALPEVMDQVDDGGSGRAHDAFRVRLGRHLSELLQREAATGPAYAPAHLEHALDDDALVPGARLVGRVDRIDLSADGRLAVAIDYKRSRAAWRDEEPQLQLPLYAEAAARAVGATSAGGLYVAIVRAEVDGRLLAGAGYAREPPGDEVPLEEWTRLVEEAQRQAGVAVAAIRAGEVPPPVGLCDVRWCPHPVLWR